MTVHEAQIELRRAYVGGGPGVLVSALVWLAAALVENMHGAGPAFAILFFGGWLIYPIGTLVCRLLFRRKPESSDNALAPVALESTIAMIGGLFAAWLFLPFQPAYVFPLAAIAVGTHYAVFKTIYGDRLFWLLGGLISLVGLAAIYGMFPLPGGMIVAVGVLELLFAVLLVLRATRDEHSHR